MGLDPIQTISKKLQPLTSKIIVHMLANWTSLMMSIFIIIYKKIGIP